MRIRILLFNSMRTPDPDTDPGSQTKTDPDPGQTLKSRKVEFLHEKYRYLKKGTGKKVKEHTGSSESTKSILKGREPGSFLLIWSISMLLDPDPHSQHGPGTETFPK
jgi:hypothetical protein